MTNRQCISSDSGALVELIPELSQYKTLSNKIIAILDDVQKQLFYRSLKAKVLILKLASEIGGSQLFFYNDLVFLCKYRIYIEDMYIREKYVGNEYYKTILKSICQLVIEKYSHRVELLCLNWNKVSIDFYLKLVIKQISDWMNYRLDRKNIEKTAK